jgi:DNA-binding winged helix-turn-helix (wHTH) protein
MAGKSVVFRFADVEVREREFTLLKAGETLSVEPKAFRVLLILLRNPGKLISKEELLNAVWGDAAVTDNSLTRSIALLRRLLGDETRNPRYIETVATVGYRFLCKVEEGEDSFAATAPVAVAAVNETGVAGNGERAAMTGAVQESCHARRTRRRWVLAVGAVVVVVLTGAAWYLFRPLPSPRITAYTQVTHDGRSKYLAATDGSRLYFTQLSPEAIEQVSAQGGETARVPINVPVTSIVLMDVSQDGSDALIGAMTPGRAADAMWVAPLVGGSAKRLGDGKDEVFSPDGLSVIYWTLEGDIFLARIDGTETRKLAHVGLEEAQSFSWSPDRKAIRFAEGGLLWELSSDGSGLHRLLPDWKEQGNQCCGKWTPDGHFYLFDLNSSSSGSQIWALDERRSMFRRTVREPIQLTSGPIHWTGVLPSKDGKKIFATGETPRGELSRFDTKTGRFQPFLGGISAEMVSFSHDGKSVAYVSFPESVLWKADRDGTNPVQLSNPSLHPVVPRWSPDDKQILFNDFTGDRYVVYTVPSEGGNPRKLLPEDNENEGDPQWSPDGKKVLFAAGDINNLEKEDLRILDLATRQVTIVPGSTGLWSTRWSPDGRYIDALAWNKPALRVFDLTSQQWSNPMTKGDVAWPDFSHDSQFIYFYRAGGDQGIFRIRVGGGQEERVVDMRSFHLTGVFFSSMSLDPTDAPLVTRDIGSNDIYALTLER